mmetsp:Transcript_46237/g.76458  ORF Transcript_46237/g.76458 Transcript_46237/m.76458 type:complete len:283 (-) Transcript_46237:150-998(-)|eukprot:CAMPEP_0119300188 /NCGR_PEP_ID=MMETSP1333-20130426/2178_1 /TAXON_ID=418940 /ORGANISM="Scyphosphaera apsteinii, Strain RCC1455" /LENGTH=282 /DNA_ID=CAMNT_0007301877 /DNA_START=436 /DNA_END=1284 /DNA_ORIENTATION=+
MAAKSVPTANVTVVENRLTDALMLLLEPLDEDVHAALTEPTILCLTFGYLLLGPLLKRSPWIDSTTGAYQGHIVCYDLLMAVYSCVTFIVTATAIGWDLGYGNWLRALSGDSPAVLRTNNCPSPVFDSSLFLLAAKTFYWSKYVEYLDTVWLVLKGKPVSFLQTFHHFGAPWDMHLGIALKNETLWIFLLFNSFVHTFMYTYYALAAARIRVPGKPLITALQLSQFLYGLHIVWEYIDIPCFRASQGLVLSWLVNYVYVVVVMLAFFHFFYHDNVKRKKKAA